jgi:hypothetical protein
MQNLSLLARNQNVLGSVQAPTEEALNWIQDKQDQIYQQNKLKLASALIDPQHPETQERAYQIMPALKKVPESHLLDEVAMQMTLNSLIRDGVLKGPEDLDFILYILNPEVNLPLTPLWDLAGVFTKDIDSLRQAQKKNELGLFSPFKYAVPITDKEANEMQLQNNVKLSIVKRLFHALRDKNNNDISKFIANIVTSRDLNNLPGKIGFDSQMYQHGKFDPYNTMLNKDK